MIKVITGSLIPFMLAIILNAIYVRIVSIRGMCYINAYSAIGNKNILLLDLRDCNKVTKVPVSGVYNFTTCVFTKVP